MSLEGYSTGGTLHIVVNNQVGFTTDTGDSRSTRYATDLARMLGIPIFHVNGEDPRPSSTFAPRRRLPPGLGRDVVIDMYCYRKYGHNEGDEPRFTQPVMYATIDKKPSVRASYVKKLCSPPAGHRGSGRAPRRAAQGGPRRRPSATKAEHHHPPTTGLAGHWAQYGRPRRGRARGAHRRRARQARAGPPRAHHRARGVRGAPEAGADRPRAAPPAHRGEDPARLGHRRGARLRRCSTRAPVRLSGQDVRARHVLAPPRGVDDAKTGARYTPFSAVAKPPGASRCGLAALGDGRARLRLRVLPRLARTLVIWEAQFGDFANGAQVIIDQFLSSSEDKWER